MCNESNHMGVSHFGFLLTALSSFLFLWRNPGCCFEGSKVSATFERIWSSYKAAGLCFEVVELDRFLKVQQLKAPCLIE